VSCDTGYKMHLADFAAKQDTDTSYVSSIIRNSKKYKIDTSVILKNKNLHRLISQIDTTKLSSSYKFANTPGSIKTFLKTISKNDFLIADTGQHFAAGCTRFGNEPFRQLTYSGFNNNFFLMTYKIGGWGLMEQIIIIKYKDEHIVDFWVGGSDSQLNTKEKILAYLKRQIIIGESRSSNLIYI